MTLIVWLLGSAGVAAECSCLALRTFTPEERVQLETQYGPAWWRALGLIPGPSTADDYVERAFGDSSVAIYSPRQFWDPRTCDSRAPDRRDPRGPKGK